MGLLDRLMARHRNETLGESMAKDRATTNVNNKEWSIVGDNEFLPSSGSVSRLPYGCYTPSYNGQTWVLKRVDMEHDRILDLDDGVQASVMDEFNTFLDRRSAYLRYGIVYKRGILLHGIPGTGKTVVLAQVSAQIIKKGGYVLTVGNRIQMAKLGLDLLKSVHPESIVVVLLEDVDGFCDEDDDEEALLELMDGNTQHSGVVYLATTNNLESIPDRVRKRPSRFDAVLEVKAPTEAARVTYLKNIDPMLPEASIAEIARLSEGMVLAHLKEVFLLHKVYGHSIAESIARVRAFCE